MNKIDIAEIYEDKFPNLMAKLPTFMNQGAIAFLKKLLHQNDINQFLKENHDKSETEFIDELFDKLNFRYYLSNRDRARIPSEGKLIITANHPLGAMDGLAIVRAIKEVRPDVKIVANQMLMQLDPLKGVFLPVDIYKQATQKESMLGIHRQLSNEGAVIFFPAAEVSRLTGKGISDAKWSKGPIKLAQKVNAPILPVHIDARNSIPFYLLSLLKREIGTFLLPHQMFSGVNKSLKFTMGDPISPRSFNNTISSNYQAKLLRKHVYLLGSGDRGIFKTEKTIIHPIDKQTLKRELLISEELGETRDKKKIYLVDYNSAKNVMREISRLRELTFRKVGEGTGNKADSDKYDRYYKHIVLWDDKDLEIVGSYRLGVCSDIIKQHGKNKLYNNELYEISSNFDSYLERGLEVGRSFVQQRYWGSNALDYLWQGIGAFLQQNPDIRYMFGAVSISDTYPEDAKALIVSYYKKWFSGDTTFVKARNPYRISLGSSVYAEKILVGASPEEDMRMMKTALKTGGYTVPVLLRRYTDICEMGGVKYLGYNVDENFGNSVDAFVVVDTEMMKDTFRQRYYTQQKALKRNPESITQNRIMESEPALA